MSDPFLSESLMLFSLKHIRDHMDAREIESLSMLHRGFTELKEANPELTYNIVLDLLQGINEYVGHPGFRIPDTHLIS